MENDSDFNWWERWPSIYNRELEAFGRHRATVRELFAKNGFLILEVAWPKTDGSELKLNVGFSPHHPHCRPSVAASELRGELHRHIDPFSGNLCLLIQEGSEWNPNQPVADLINEQLPKIISANADREGLNFEAAADVEEHAPDPLSAYFEHICEPNSGIFFDGNCRVGSAKFGIATYSIRPRPNSGGNSSFEAYLRKIETADGRRLHTIPSKWNYDDINWAPIEGPWIKLIPPRSASAEELHALASSEIEKASILRPRFLGKLRSFATQRFRITAISFEDEIDYSADGRSDDWFFLASRSDGPAEQSKHNLVRAYRLDQGILSRVPATISTAGKNVLLLGTGAIGSFAAIELARAGVKQLVLFDHDALEPGNSVRWPLGQEAWGKRKVVAIAEFLSRHYPRTEVLLWNGKIGGAISDVSGAENVDVNQYQHIAELVDDADLVIDTTASLEVQQAITCLCRNRHTDCIVANATEGAAGGLIAIFHRECRSCYVCMRERWNTESLKEPPADENGTMVPVGCNSSTFTGAAFDLQEISLSTVRFAVRLLKNEQQFAGAAKYARLSLREADLSSLPRWEIFDIEPMCAHCAGGQG